MARHLRELPLFVLPRDEAEAEPGSMVDQRSSSFSGNESGLLLACPLCRYKFHRRNAYVRHLDEAQEGIHTRSELLRCSLCPNQFKDHDKYLDHLEDVHKEIYPRFRRYMKLDRPRRNRGNVESDEGTIAKDEEEHKTVDLPRAQLAERLRLDWIERFERERLEREVALKEEEKRRKQSRSSLRSL